jgi:resuscitation-promoting factor RpfB
VVRAAATIRLPESAGSGGHAGLGELDAILAKVAHTAQARRPRPTPKQVARRMLAKFGWSKRQFRYLNLLWSAESGWSVYATNPYSGAYGIPQAVPGAKMATAGPKWWSSARTQIRWGLRYIKECYGSPEAAWEHELSTGWY